MHTFALLILSILFWNSALLSKEVKVTFLHFNDIYELQDNDGIGGMPMLMTALEQARANAKNSFTIVSGDFLSPSLISEFTKGSQMVALFNALKVDMVTLGNHEFDFGVSILKKRMKESTFDWLSSNILDSTNQPLEGTIQTIIKEVEGVKIGFAGLLTPKTKKLSKKVADLTFISPVSAAKTAVSKLKAAGADVIVLVTHLSIAEDRVVAKKVKGINLILGGHDHIPITYYEKDVLIQKSGVDGEFLGIVNLNISIETDKDGGRKVRIIPGWCLQPIYQLPSDPEIAKMVSHYAEVLDKDLGVPLAKTEVYLDSRNAIVRGQESTMGDLIADALRDSYHADIALINGGAIRGNKIYPAGTTLTRKNLYQELPFDNVAVVLKIKGTDLLSTLEHGLAALPKLDGRFPQISGAQVTYNPQNPADHRIERLTINGHPLDLNKSYRLVTTDFLYGGGDGYEMLAKGDVVLGGQYTQLIINSVLNYLEAHPVIESKGSRFIVKE